MLMLGLLARVLDVRRAFLQGKLDDDEEQTRMKVPDGLDEHYVQGTVLKLLALIWWLKRVDGFLQDIEATHEKYWMQQEFGLSLLVLYLGIDHSSID